jgi:hypothetical protein
VTRAQRLSILAALILQGCGIFPEWPKLPPKGTCRSFAMTSWGGGAPWDELNWARDIVHIDEPMLTQWGWKGDLGNPADTCGPIGVGMVKERIAKARATYPAKKVWLNWSAEEWIAVTSMCPEPPGLGADIVSMDSYGGIWDWDPHMKHRLGQMHRLLEPGQMMGLVPEAHYYPAAGTIWEPIDYVMIGSLYFDFAMRHQDRVFALAPFYWKSGPDMLGMEGNPQVAAFYANVTVEYPRCEQ